jgi:hypothetical protein
LSGVGNRHVLYTSKVEQLFLRFPLN